MTIRSTLGRFAVAVLGLAAFAGTAHAQGLTGTVAIDGSSTVYPITAAIAEEFSKDNPNVRATVGISGTGGGMKRFATGETDISNASRPIKGEEFQAATSAGVKMIEIPVAYDGLSVVIHPSNTFVNQMTVDELKKIFLAEGAAKTWKDVNPAWPAEEIKIYSPGTDSGTFDYFKEVMSKDGGAIRSDMQVSEDDNVLVRGVTGDKNAIGFFGYAYYEENKESLKVVPIINEAGKAVTPSTETIETGEYSPFSRPLFIYVNAESARKPAVKAFIEFYLENAIDLVGDVGYVALPEDIYEAAADRFESGTTGSTYLGEDGKARHGALRDVYMPK